MKKWVQVLAIVLLPTLAWANIGIGPLQIVAGSGQQGTTDKPGIDATLNSPSAMAVDNFRGRLWFFDAGSKLLRWVDLGLANRVITVPGQDAVFGKKFEINSMVANEKGLVATANNGRDLYQVTFDPLVKRRICKGERLEVLGARTNGSIVLFEKDKGTMQLAQEKTPGHWELCEIPGWNKVDLAAWDGKTLYGLIEAPFQLLSSDTDQGLSVVAKSYLSVFSGYKPNLSGARFVAGKYEDGQSGIFYLEGKSLQLMQVMKDEKKVISLPMPNAQGFNQSGETYWHQYISPFRSCGDIEVDRSERKIYLSDPLNNRIIFLKDREYDKGGWGFGSREFNSDYACASKKPAGVCRILWYGSSFSFASTEPSGKFAALNKASERYLNLMSVAQESDKDFEVVFDGKALVLAGVGTDVFSYTINQLEKRKIWSPDMIVLSISNADVFYSIMGYLYRPLGSNGLPKDGPDPEFYFEKDPVKRYKEPSLSLYKYFSKRKEQLKSDFRFDDSGRVFFEPGSEKQETASDVYALFEDKEFLEVGKAIFGACLKALDEKVQTVMPGTKLLVFMLPQRNHLGYQEMVPEGRFSKSSRIPEYKLSCFIDAYASNTISVIDLGPKMEKYGMAYHPLFRRDDHMSVFGNDFAGYLMASKIWESWNGKR